MNFTFYITYDLQAAAHATQPSPEPSLRGAKELLIPGPLLHWEVGEFPNASGVKHHGVQVRYRDPKTGYEQIQLVEVPANARNVSLRDRIPSEYRAALNSAA